MKSHQAMDLLLNEAFAVTRNPSRNGQILHLPSEGELLIAGDLHNHRRNFERIVKLASLAAFPQRHVLLQELIHGGALGAQGEDNSLDLLLDAIAWSQQFPGQVHFILSNHDWAQIFGMAIIKDGYDLTERFNRAMAVHFGSRAGAASAAFRQFVLALPLACITINGLLACHSLPGPADMPHFDPGILTRSLGLADYVRMASVYRMIWGRHQTAAVVDELARLWFTEIFICGHQSQETGFGELAGRMFIIDSSHNHGAVVTLDLARQYTLASLSQQVIPLAAIG